MSTCAALAITASLVASALCYRRALGLHWRIVAIDPNFRGLVDLVLERLFRLRK